MGIYHHSHYFVNGGWFEEDDHIMSRIDTIRHIPATIVQGRYDMITPMKTAWELHKVYVWNFEYLPFTYILMLEYRTLVMYIILVLCACVLSVIYPILFQL